MADKAINELPGIQEVYDDSLIPIEQQGEAHKMTGRQFRQFGEKAVEKYVQPAIDAANQAEEASSAAKIYADRATEARNAIEDMTVTAQSLTSSSGARATKSAVGNSFNIHFGIPRGEQGPAGPQGPQGIQGPAGPRGIDGVAVSATGFYAFNVNEEGNLLLSYTGDEAPDFQIREDGHLYYNIV